jgi:hypothetical protein
MDFRMRFSRTGPSPEEEEEEQWAYSLLRSFYSLLQTVLQVSDYNSLCLLLTCPRNGGAPSPYIGERVAYRGRKPQETLMASLTGQTTL